MPTAPSSRGDAVGSGCLRQPQTLGAGLACSGNADLRVRHGVTGDGQLSLVTALCLRPSPWGGGRCTACLAQPLRGLRSPQDVCGVPCSCNRSKFLSPSWSDATGVCFGLRRKICTFLRKDTWQVPPEGLTEWPRWPPAEQGGLRPEPLALGSPGCVTLGRSRVLAELLCGR